MPDDGSIHQNQKLTQSRKAGAQGAALTHRQRQIIRLVSEGLPNKQVARRLDVAEATVKAHLRNIFLKLRVDNRTALAAAYLSPPDNRGHQHPAAGKPDDE